MKLKKLFKREDGNAIILFTLAITALIAVTGLVIDGGMLYMTKTHLQKTANAAVLSGAQELTNDDTRVREIVEETLAHHDELDSMTGIIILPETKVTVQLEKPVDMTFMRLFGVETVDVKARATARIATMGRAIGAAPLGIDERIELIYGQEYTLKVDETGVDTGNFGILALDGPGARTYKETLLNGSSQEISVGDIVNTQTGNIAGPTKEAVDILVDSCDNMYERDCRRILLIPVYRPYNHNQNQLKQVEITGFAYFYILERMNHRDKTIRGIFLKRTGSGYEVEDAVNRGAYTVKLTKD